MMTYFDEIYREGADVDEVEMKKSDSKDKYLHGECVRQTRVLNLDVILSKTSFETYSSIPNESEFSHANPNFSHPNAFVIMPHNL